MGQTTAYFQVQENVWLLLMTRHQTEKNLLQNTLPADSFRKFRLIALNLLNFSEQKASTYYFDLESWIYFYIVPKYHM